MVGVRTDGGEVGADWGVVCVVGVGGKGEEGGKGAGLSEGGVEVEDEEEGVGGMGGGRGGA